MHWLIAGLNGLFDACLSLPRALGEGTEMGAVALLLGVVTAAAFHRLADRPGLAAALRDLRAGLLETWLYRHDPALVLRAQWQLVRANGRYLRGLLPPWWSPPRWRRPCSCSPGTASAWSPCRRERRSC